MEHPHCYGKGEEEEKWREEKEEKKEIFFAIPSDLKVWDCAG